MVCSSKSQTKWQTTRTAWAIMSLVQEQRNKCTSTVTRIVEGKVFIMKLFWSIHINSAKRGAELPCQIDRSLICNMQVQQTSVLFCLVPHVLETSYMLSACTRYALIWKLMTEMAPAPATDDPALFGGPSQYQVKTFYFATECCFRNDVMPSI